MLLIFAKDSHLEIDGHPNLRVIKLKWSTIPSDAIFFDCAHLTFSFWSASQWKSQAWGTLDETQLLFRHFASITEWDSDFFSDNPDVLQALGRLDGESQPVSTIGEYGASLPEHFETLWTMFWTCLQAILLNWLTIPDGDRKKERPQIYLRNPQRSL